MSLKRDIELLFEIGSFRNIDRAWKQFFTSDTANNAEHTFRVVWLALTIAKYEKNKNHEKILKMALVHDLPESRTGDAHYISKQYTVRHEDKSIKDVFKSTSLEREVIDLWQEYEKRKSPEAKIVKDADNLDVDLEIQEGISRGYELGKIWRKDRIKYIYPKLFTKSAKKLHREIIKSKPYGWQVNSHRTFFEKNG